MAKPAWILHFKDIGQEDAFLVFQTETAALKRMVESIAYYAKEQLEALEWDEEPTALLKEIINLEKKGEHSNVIATWRDFDFDYGPQDQDVFLIDSEVAG